MVGALKKIFDSSAAACMSFLGKCLQEDNAEYLLDLLLECTDASSRNMAGDLIEYCLLKLKTVEKDLILEKDANGEPKAYSVKFINRCFDAFKTKAAKNQHKF
jgi:hypothetical protein